MRRLFCALPIIALCACADDPQATRLTEQARTAALVPQPLYQLEIIDTTLGGAVAVGTSVNNAGWIAGYSTRRDNSRGAIVLRDGELDSLGTLGGRNSAVQWPGINDTGMIVGISFTADADPHNAAWSCEAFMGATDRTCKGFYWHGGDMKPLEPLGGYNSFATSVNNNGQIVGWAETAVHDNTCRGTQVLGFKAVLWEPATGRKTMLAPLPGDSASAATAINDRGQVVGISGSCYVAVGDSSARASVLWENGVPREIPNLGGATWNTPMDINEAGHVVGFSNIGDEPAGSPRLFAFLWTGGSTAINLQTLGGDNMSQAYGINARGQVVGRSCGATGCRAFLYDHGVMYDLNALLDPQGGKLELARHINDAGVITGNITHGGRVKLFVARPNGYRRAE
ncbi:MAG TPA: hypothetical protein VGD27_15060 [Longimicrobiales bacterium]